jgi:hypothetical protein
MHYYVGTCRKLHVSRKRIKCIIQKKGAAVKALDVTYLKLVFVFSRTRKTTSWYQTQLSFIAFLTTSYWYKKICSEYVCHVCYSGTFGLADGYYCCVVDRLFFCLLPFLPDWCMHCRFSDTLSVTQYLFILCSVRWRGMVAPRVYRAGHVCRNVRTVAALCSSWLESAEPLRTAMSEWSWKIILLTWVLFASVCCLPNSSSYTERFETRSSREQQPWYGSYRDLPGYNTLYTV